MKRSIRQKLRNGKRRAERREQNQKSESRSTPMFTGQTIQLDFLDRVRAFGAGGVGLVHTLMQRIGLRSAIDRELKLLKRHQPYFESDHILNLAYNIVSGGTCIEDLERLRSNEAYLAGLGTPRIPDPTTAGDFVRRLDEASIEKLMDIVNRTRVKIWNVQPESFRDEARIYVDGTIAETLGDCKQGIDIAYNRKWGYHPLLVSLENSREPLFLVNRPGNRPSHDGAVKWIDTAIDICSPVFKRVLLAGDTDFGLTGRFDAWSDRGVRFVLGLDAGRHLLTRAVELDERAWKELERPAKSDIQTQPRQRPDNIKRSIVEERGYEVIKTVREDVAEFPYQPLKCTRPYRVVALRKELVITSGQRELFPDVRYFFYVTNDWTLPIEEVVFTANARCNQENLIEQLKNGVHAMSMPVHDLNSNWAYMVITSLAWTIKAWFGLLHPDQVDRLGILRMEFKAFLHNFMLIPCQVIRSGRRIIHRLLSYSSSLRPLFRLADKLVRLRLA